MMQFFHWYSPADGTLWDEAAASAGSSPRPASRALWLPPAYKGDRRRERRRLRGLRHVRPRRVRPARARVRTKYGTKKQYARPRCGLHRAGLQVYADAVLNHRMGGDATELVRATPFPQDDRLRPSGEPREIEAYTRFRFPGRKGKYSAFEWRARHFDAVDYDHRSPDEKNTVYLLEGKQFDDQVALENGQLLLPDGRRPRLREPGGPRRGRPPGASGTSTRPVSTASGSTPSSTSRPGSSRSGSTRWSATRRRTCSSSASTGPRTSARSAGTSTGWAAASPCSACRCTTTSTTRAAPAATTTCAGCSTARSCSSAAATS